MDLGEWLREFRVLHDRARRWDLAGDDRSAYLGARDELARALMAAQRLPVSPGSTPRQALSVARGLQVDLDTPLENHRVMTLTISASGFSALLAKAPRSDDAMKCSIRLPGGERIETTAKPVGTKQRVGSATVSFAFGTMAEGDRERIEMIVFDSAREQLSTAR
jgi:hypothetical protein